MGRALLVRFHLERYGEGGGALNNSEFIGDSTSPAYNERELSIHPLKVLVSLFYKYVGLLEKDRELLRHPVGWPESKSAGQTLGTRPSEENFCERILRRLNMFPLEKMRGRESPGSSAAKTQKKIF